MNEEPNELKDPSTSGSLLYQLASPSFTVETNFPTFPNRKRTLFCDEFPVEVSPSIELAENLEVLSTSCRKKWREINPARRKLSLVCSHEVHKQREKKLSLDDGCFIESPSTSSTSSPDSARLGEENILFGRFASEPNCGLEKKIRSSSVCLFPEVNSNTLTSSRRNSNDDKENKFMFPVVDQTNGKSLVSCFKSPTLTPKMKKVAFRNQTNSKDMRSSAHGRLVRCSSHVASGRCRRLSIKKQDSIDDGFVEQFKSLEETPSKVDLPKNFERLLFSPVIECQEVETTSSSNNKDSNSFSQMTTSLFVTSNASDSVLFSSCDDVLESKELETMFSVGTSYKRSSMFTKSGASLISFRPCVMSRSESVDEQQLSHSPMRSKRRRSDAMGCDQDQHSSLFMLTKYHSEAELCIKSALNLDEVHQDLIGDFSIKYSLPLIRGRHQDLKTISIDTLASLLKNEYSHVVDSFTTVDCRYPYEFKGGHIQGAVNVHSTEDLITEFFSKLEDQLVQRCSSDNDYNSDTKVNVMDTKVNVINTGNNTESDSQKRRNIIIFHCEFSSERGPKLSRFLRKTDRRKNTDLYPFLYYPELYLLEGGYKAFYEVHPDLCEPQGYVPMSHPNHSSDLRFFRNKSCLLLGSKSLSKSLFTD